MRQTGIEAKNALRCLLMICVLIGVVGGLTAAQTAEQVPAPGTVAPGESNALLLGARDVTKALIQPSYTFYGAAHVANGVALRNRTSGTISLRGVPDGSVVLMALLYWNFSDTSASGLPQLPVLFDGNLILGHKTADSADPAWGMAGNHSYVADVTPFVINQPGHPNQDYVVVLLFGSATSTTGQNPWQPYEVQSVRNEGATLVVIYRTWSSWGPLFVYDDLSNSMFWSSATFNLAHPLVSGPAQFTMAGADGQVHVTNELTFFNGAQIAGCPITNSDWDGSDGWPLPQLWDTHTHVVSVSGTSSVVKYVSSGDALVPVVFILDLN